MLKGFFNVPEPKNEPVFDYAPGTPARAKLQAALQEARSKEVDVPMYIGSEEVRTGNKIPLSPPHDHQHLLGHFHEGDKSHVEQAINAALGAKEAWETMEWEQRAAIFLKAADLIAGPYRYKMNAATMLGQSKNAFQAEIDSACEIVDFLRFNVKYMTEIYKQQPPISGDGVWNRLEQRPLEGFVFALTPFNFTAIAGNLPTAPAMMGNTVVWKPAYTQIYTANLLMQVFREAGVPDGVINLVYVDGPAAGEVIFEHPEFAGIHFTGSTAVFQTIWKTIGNNIEKYKSYPRIVGETGGKDFVIAHKSADAKQLATGLVRGAFEFQGQKCSAASRAYIPSNLWEDVKKYMQEDLASIKMGGPEDFSNFINAVIDEKSFDKIAKYIDTAKSDGLEVVAGGHYDKSKGYFVEPTVLLTKDPMYTTMCEEIFGPVLTIYVYQEDHFEEALELVDQTSPYGLTGAIFSHDRYAAQLATQKLRNAAGNFYINDKPTGAVVGQQPFGGARKSGTNDKAGAMINMLRWVSPRTIKETFVTPTDYRYPFLGED
ncbi:L-glutamate gamma-semialdehyde dehydrogenase [Echinicola vietnamensis]|uniref:L-glutamate gamma-semialdehyde dehydrogenase n=1 Tax=Echinicola vietnamensis (strain DSM 17526 / LMG 23754 / KMM 6221) TaxID=926556 RepID=L0FXV6_ECHVK|nr:L-glutamate gamma-semialdehyde dehydrogenase [Echinicola vietnamensis]AGA77571.1 delta-1-pyrroline-5-carboxylate dehydrogenase, group 1 [Echinicola vietnamensis DSM 17526]